MKISIVFPMVKEKTGYRRGPRFRMTPDTRGLGGAAGCAARMIACAIRKRDSARRMETDGRTEAAAASVRIDRAGMREHALWARLFAQQIAKDDPRLEEARQLCHELVEDYCRDTVEA